MRKLAFIFLFFLYSIPAVSAIGFANFPENREFVFKPGLSMDIPLYVINSDRIKFTVATPEGHNETLGTPDDDNIGRYVSVDDPNPGGPAREVILKFRLPQQMRPGTYNVDVYAQGFAEDAMVAAVASVKLRFVVRVLSPEKKIDITNFAVPPIPEGLNGNVTLSVISRTTQNIDAVYAQVKVYQNGVVVSDTKSMPVSLKSEETADINVKLNTEVLSGGDYEINATVFYDGNSVDSPNDILKIGTLHVGLQEYTNSFTYNTTNQFLFNISNMWNRELKDAYCEVKIGNQVKKSASQNIPSFGKTQYELYFDRDELMAPGTVEPNITVSYKDYNPASKTYVQKQESFPARLSIVLPPVVEKKWYEENLLLYGLLVAMVLIILLILVLIFVLLRQKHEPSGSGDARSSVVQKGPNESIGSSQSTGISNGDSLKKP